MNKAVSLYGTIGDVKCELRGNSVEEFKAFLFKVGNLRVLVQRVQKEFLLRATGMNTTTAEINRSFVQLIFGETSVGIKAAPTQAIADALFDLETLWWKLEAALENSTAIVAQDSLSTTREGVKLVMTIENIEAIMAAYVRLAQEKVSADELLPRRLDLASRQRMLAEQMAKEALLVSESSGNDRQLRRTRLLSTMASYESAHAKLVDQTHVGRDRVLMSMKMTQTAFIEYEKYLLLFVDGSPEGTWTATQKRLDLLSVILEENEVLYAEVVPEPDRTLLLVLQASVPITLICAPIMIGLISRAVSYEREIRT
eukprot:TRINITY_DN914_c1_g1_i1.p1 TRINITY_DN914_c1_g1~~TRINITY_DN914_c1_g1_i1.p1  ORF type:complete len:352 (+),score=43.04 TRINITY_DN914_c1_g1_i1:119-1057(+)